MRIRRNAARVLGSASAFFPLSSPPISAPAAPPAEPAAFSSHCELNCSPWDVDFDPKIEEEDGRAEETVDEQQPAVAAAASAAVTAGTEIEIKDDGMTEAIEEENENGVTSKEEQKVTDPKTAKKTCSKKGKGWECTRPAEQPHPFCHYHLTILRSYKSGRRPRKNNWVEAVPVSAANRSPSSCARKRTWKKEARASAAADPDSIIYYGSFGTSEVKIKEDGEGSVGHQVPGFDVLADDTVEHAAEEPDVVYCKKNDGKGWNCKRPAALPSYFCSHHLAQMKAYSSNQYQNSRDSVELKTTAASDASESKKLQTTTATPDKSKGKKRALSKKRKAAAAAGSSSGFNGFYFSSSRLKDFYYYGKFVPWRKKSRGARAEVEAQAEEVEAQVEEVEEVKVEEENNVRAEKFVMGIIDINVPPSDVEDDGDGVAQRV